MENFFYIVCPSLLPTYRYLIVIENVDQFSISLEDSQRESYQKEKSLEILLSSEAQGRSESGQKECQRFIFS